MFDLGTVTNQKARFIERRGRSAKIPPMTATRTVPAPTWGLSSKQHRLGCQPITGARGVNLDADWLAAFHRAPFTHHVEPIAINSFLPHKKALRSPIKHKPAL